VARLVRERRVGVVRLERAQQPHGLAEAARVCVVVRFRAGSTHPAPPGAPPGTGVLDAWLAARFRPADRIGRYEVWVR
jgi:hypothetical protein